MTFIPRRLIALKFRSHPFGYPLAESLDEDMIDNIFIPSVFSPTSDDPSENILTFPGSTIIVGWGKSMACRWLEVWARRQRNLKSKPAFGLLPVYPLVISYHHFQNLVEKSAETALSDHRELLLQALAAASLPILVEKEELFRIQPAGYRQRWSAFLAQFLPECFEQLEEYERVSPTLVNQLYAERGALNPFRPAEEASQSLGRVMAWLRALGVDGSYITVDNIGGYAGTKETRAAAGLLRPLIKTDGLFQIEGLYWKIFLPEPLAEALLEPDGMSSPRFKVFQIRWDKQSLSAMTGQALRYASDGKVGQLDFFCDEAILAEETSVAEKLAGLALRMPGSPPHNLHRLANAFLQQKDEESSYLISAESWKAFLFVKEHEQEIRQAINRQGEKQKTGNGHTMEQTKYLQTRKQDLENALNSAAKLLSHYQQELVLLSNPREQARYEHDMLEIKANITQLRSELDEVLRELDGTPSETAAEPSSLAQLYARLDKLDRQVAEISQVLEYYPEERHKKLAFTIIQELDDQQFQAVRDVLEAHQAGRLPEEDTRSLVRVLDAAITVPSATLPQPEQELLGETRAVVSQVDLPVNSKVKFSIPIVPLLVQWDIEVGLDGKVDLKTLWKEITAKVRGQK